MIYRMNILRNYNYPFEVIETKNSINFKKCACCLAKRKTFSLYFLFLKYPNNGISDNYYHIVKRVTCCFLQALYKTIFFPVGNEPNFLVRSTGKYLVHSISFFWPQSLSLGQAYFIWGIAAD